MKETLKILYIEDEQEPREKLVKLLQSETINGYEIEISGNDNFDTSIEFVSDYQMVILDIFKGKAGDGGNASGEEVLREIQQSFFVPVIFYSGNVESVKHLRSQVIGVATKGDGGIDELKHEIERLTKHNIPFLRNSVHAYVEKEFKEYFWDVIQKENDKFTPNADDFSLGYMLLRNFADSLSKENIKNILGDDSINHEKVHPMEFYIYPIDSSKEFENGEIIKNKTTNEIFVVLTPSCDFIERFKKGKNEGRSADKVLLVKTKLLTECKEFKTYQQTQNNDNKSKLEKLINSGKSDRYFFLPKVPFIENRVIDFQLNNTISYDDLTTGFERIAKLDSPFAQSMTSSYIRYYNRIGFPDIDTEYVINHLNI